MSKRSFSSYDTKSQTQTKIQKTETPPTLTRSKSELRVNSDKDIDNFVRSNSNLLTGKLTRSKSKQLDFEFPSSTQAVQSSKMQMFTSLMYESYRPIRIKFPIGKEVEYKNGMFTCMTCTGSWNDNEHDQFCFWDTHIKTLVWYLTKIFVKDYIKYTFKLQRENDMYVLDTEGKLPTRYVHMLKDFYFKDDNTVTIDYDSKVTYDEVKDFWKNTLNEYSLNMLQKVVFNCMDFTEEQMYEFKIIPGCPVNWDRFF
jgi:hypothetical protein